MKKRILSLALSLSLAISLFAPAYAAETEPVTPTAPEWIRAEDYLIFPDDEVYLPENWAEIEFLRQQVRDGATTLTGMDGKELSTTATTGSAGRRYEVALARLKCAENVGVTTYSARGIFRDAGRAFSDAMSAWKNILVEEGDELYYRLGLYKARAYLLDTRSFDYNVRWSVVGSLSSAITYLGITMNDFYDAPHMELITPEQRYKVLEELNDYRFGRGLPILPAEDGSIQIFLDDGYIKLDVPATMVNSRTMIPIRAVAEALGADVGWEEATRQITLTRAGTTIVMTVDSPAATVNGESITMDVAPYISGGRTLIPVRYVAEFFGQKVDWDGDNLRVYISENKSVVGDSNLEAWALPMGAMLASINAKETPLIFGGIVRTAEAVTYCRQSLGGWGISSREGLVSTVISMTLYGHNATFRSMAADVKQTPEEQREAISEASDAWPYFMWAYTEELEEKWGDRGIMAWDLFRMSNLVQWGYVAGYVTYEEALALLEPAATLVSTNFSSWDDAYENYLDGYTWWARTNAEKWANTRIQLYDKNMTYGDQIKEYETQEGWQDWMVVPRGTIYFGMKTTTYEPRLPLLFDDSLFQTGVIGLPE